MGWAGWADELPYRPSRVLVAGASGSGKSTLARRVAAALNVPYQELDVLFHGPAWEPRAEFVDDVERLSAAGRWSTEWQYPDARQILASRADLLVFLDLPRWLVMMRVVRRTLWRRLGRIELWNGNFEPPLRTLLHDRDHIVRWSWRTHHEQIGRVSELIEQRPDLPVVRLQTRRQVDRWLAGPLDRAARS
jgi:adenylate kinase family enzyme